MFGIWKSQYKCSYIYRQITKGCHKIDIFSYTLSERCGLYCLRKARKSQKGTHILHRENIPRERFSVSAKGLHQKALLD